MTPDASRIRARRRSPVSVAVRGLGPLGSTRLRRLLGLLCRPFLLEAPPGLLRVRLLWRLVAHRAPLRSVVFGRFSRINSSDARPGRASITLSGVRRLRRLLGMGSLALLVATFPARLAPVSSLGRRPASQCSTVSMLASWSIARLVAQTLSPAGPKTTSLRSSTKNRWASAESSSSATTRAGESRRSAGVSRDPRLARDSPLRHDRRGRRARAADGEPRRLRPGSPSDGRDDDQRGDRVDRPHSRSAVARRRCDHGLGASSRCRRGGRPECPRPRRDAFVQPGRIIAARTESPSRPGCSVPAWWRPPSTSRVLAGRPATPTTALPPPCPGRASSVPGSSRSRRRSRTASMR